MKNNEKRKERRTTRVITIHSRMIVIRYLSTDERRTIASRRISPNERRTHGIRRGVDVRLWVGRVVVNHTQLHILYRSWGLTSRHDVVSGWRRMKKKERRTGRRGGGTREW